MKKLIRKMLPARLREALAKMHVLFRKKFYLGMTSRYEQEYFENYARKEFSGKGEIVDLGCWMGSTTIPLAKGLSSWPRAIIKDKKIHAYDQFIWEGWMNDFAKGCYHKWKEGESFLPEFKQRTAKWASLIETHAGDLRKLGWTGGDIEFLLIDAMKSWELANSILKNFFPYLIPGYSYVVHQDFKHYYCSWIHLLNYRFRDNFITAYNIPSSASLVVKYIKPIDINLLRAPYSFESFSAQEIENAFDYSLGLVAEHEQSIILAAKAMCFIHKNETDRARAIIKQFLATGVTPAPSSDIAIVKKMLS